MYPFLSERAAKAFARNHHLIREAQHRPGIDSGPRDRLLADRYKKASDYLYSRIGRTEPGMSTEPGYELVNDNEAW